MNPNVVKAQFIDKKGYQNRMIKLVVVLVLLVVIATVVGPHIVVTTLAIITCLLAGIAFTIFFKGKDSVIVSLSKSSSGTFEVIIRGVDFEVLNPTTVYFGVTYQSDGNHHLRLGIPAKRKMVVLEETLQSGMILTNVPEFKLPKGTKKPHFYLSRRPYPGDLTEVVKFLGFV
jgi:hypothetical protein